MRIHRLQIDADAPGDLSGRLAAMLPGVPPDRLREARALALQVAAHLTRRAQLEWTMTSPNFAAHRATFLRATGPDGAEDASVSVVVEDRTRAHADQATQRAHREHLPVATLEVRDGQIHHANAAARTMLGGSVRDGAPVLGLVPPDEQPGLIPLLSGAAVGANRTARVGLRGGAGRVTLTASRPPGIPGALLLTIVEDPEARKEHERAAATDRLATVGRLAAGVAHEINNPMTFVTLNLALLEEDLADLQLDPEREAGIRQQLADARVGADRVTEIVHRLLRFANVSARDDEAGAPGPALQLALKLGRFAMPDRIEVRTNEQAGLPATRMGTGPLSQVLLNLLVNASDAMDQAGTAEPCIVVDARHDHGSVEITVTDNGPGVPESARSAIFDPFFTTKEPGRGTGLGLAISRRMVADAGGQLSLEPTPIGARFRVRMPAAGRAEPPVPTPPPLATGHGKLLIVDDEPQLRRALRATLRADWEVSEAENGADAIAQLEAGLVPDAILCDICMPRMDGRGFADWLASNRPTLLSRLVWLTGGTLDPEAQRTASDSQRPVLAKPARIDELRAALESAKKGGPEDAAHAANRRRQERFPARGLRAIIDTGDSPHDAQVVDISEGGLRLRNGMLSADALRSRELRIMVGAQTGPLVTLQAQIAWHRASERGSVDYGLQLPSDGAGHPSYRALVDRSAP